MLCDYCWIEVNTGCSTVYENVWFVLFSTIDDFNRDIPACFGFCTAPHKLRLQDVQVAMLYLCDYVAYLPLDQHVKWMRTTLNRE